MQPGINQTLTIETKIDSGFVLIDPNTGEKAFIPNIFTESNWQVDDEVDVFVYQEDGKFKATTETPYAKIGEYAVLNCIQTLPSGAFMDWGIIKDLFVPYKEQKGKMEVGKRYLVHVYQDEETGLVTGSAKFKRNMSYTDFPLKAGDEVSLLMMNETELGWNVVINKKYIGLVYANDVFKKIYPYSDEVGYIKTVREDGKIDVTLQPQGFENIDAFKEKILQVLEANYGLLYISDKSSPEEIKAEFEMSKKNFKKAIGGLYRDKKIDIKDDRLILL